MAEQLIQPPTVILQEMLKNIRTSRSHSFISFQEHHFPRTPNAAWFRESGNKLFGYLAAVIETVNNLKDEVFDVGEMLFSRLFYFILFFVCLLVCTANRVII